jgi:hypothetical protein
VNTYIKYLELAAFIASLIAWPVLRKSRYLKVFPVLLGLIVAGEFYGYYLRLTKGNNTWFYNFFNPCQFILYLLILYRAIDNKRLRGLMLAGCVFIAISALLGLEPSFRKMFNIYMYSLGAMLVITGVAAKIYEMVNVREDSFLRSPVFYIFFSIIFFYIGTLPILVMNNWLAKFDFFNSIRQVLVITFTILNFVLYGTYTYCFLWLRRKATY